MRHKMEIDGVEVAFTEGETILEVAQRHQKEIPTLCYDPRLEPFRWLSPLHRRVRGCAKSCSVLHNESHTRYGCADSNRYDRSVSEDIAGDGVSENREVDVSPLRGYASGELANLRDKYGINGTNIQGQRQARVKPMITRLSSEIMNCASRAIDVSASVLNKR